MTCYESSIFTALGRYQQDQKNQADDDRDFHTVIGVEIKNMAYCGIDAAKDAKCSIFTY